MDFTPVIVQILGMMTWFMPAVFILLMLTWLKGNIVELLVRLLVHRQSYERTCVTPPNTKCLRD